jgi:hypothetical protein
VACDDETNLKDAIEANAKRGIASTTVGERSTTAMDPLKQIEVAKYLDGNAAIAATGSAWGCLRPARMVPPGSIGPSER